MVISAFTPPSGTELIIILAVLVLLFGARKLPELGSSVGKTITNFRKGMKEAEVELDDEEAAGEESQDRDSAKDRDDA